MTSLVVRGFYFKNDFNKVVIRRKFLYFKKDVAETIDLRLAIHSS